MAISAVVGGYRKLVFFYGNVNEGEDGVVILSRVWLLFLPDGGSEGSGGRSCR